jgi:hypothetical protein
MTIQVELNAEIAAQLMAEARVQGIPLEKVAERLLQEAGFSLCASRESDCGRVPCDAQCAVSRFRGIAQAAD